MTTKVTTRREACGDQETEQNYKSQRDEQQIRGARVDDDSGAACQGGECHSSVSAASCPAGASPSAATSPSAGTPASAAGSSSSTFISRLCTIFTTSSSGSSSTVKIGRAHV